MDTADTTRAAAFRADSDKATVAAGNIRPIVSSDNRKAAVKTPSILDVFSGT